jgi:hypothetical protein
MANVKCQKGDISSPFIADRRAELADVTQSPMRGSSSATQTSPTAVIPYIKSSQVSLVFPSVRSGDKKSLSIQSLYKHRTVLCLRVIKANMAQFAKATFNSKNYLNYRPTYTSLLYKLLYDYHRLPYGTAVDLGCGPVVPSIRQD